MTQEHFDVVTQLQQDVAASDRAQIELLLSDKALPDPLDCGRPAYEQVLAILQQRLPKLLTGD